MWRLVIIVSILLLAGCKSREKLGQNIYPNCKYGMYSKEEVIQKSDSSKINFNWMKIKTKVDVEYQKKKYNLQVQLRVKKDSAVFAKVSKSGITIILASVTADTLVFVDRLNKNYFKGKYNQLQGLIGISLPFTFIQNIFLSQPTFFYEADGFKKVQESVINYSSKSFESDLSDSVIHQIQSFTCDSLRLRSVGIIDSKSSKEVWFDYDKYGDINGNPLNKKIHLEGIQDKNPLILADIELKRIKMFDYLSTPIDIPNDYKKLEIK